MEDSILGSIKNAVNVSIDDRAFDDELAMFIGSTFSELHQLGVLKDPVEFDSTMFWGDLPVDEPALSMVKTYVFLEAKLVFDPPVGSVLTAYEHRRDEYEWRLNVMGSEVNTDG